MLTTLFFKCTLPVLICVVNSATIQHLHFNLVKFIFFINRFTPNTLVNINSAREPTIGWRVTDLGRVTHLLDQWGVGAELLQPGCESLVWMRLAGVVRPVTGQHVGQTDAWRTVPCTRQFTNSVRTSDQPVVSSLKGRSKKGCAVEHHTIITKYKKVQKIIVLNIYNTKYNFLNTKINEK